MAGDISSVVSRAPRAHFVEYVPNREGRRGATEGDRPDVWGPRVEETVSKRRADEWGRGCACGCGRAVLLAGGAQSSALEREGSGRYCIEKELDAIVLYYIDAEDSSYAFYEEDLSNDQEQDDTLDKVPITGSGPTSGTACCIPF
ncbi:hypothetical protein E2562_034566 [Oryza meyeriana var. granulata]|uniref:Uncharacterized protein n=1 Tax=Oryza meyeriana var. granulata TaxID=110450 RepID=A0A6G1CWA5_9ORYZ|nr:hypothetical protein E2562_034566 [Oryza meyeriana var. granulata]